MTLWNSTTPTLHKEPPLIRDSSTAHKGSSLMAGGGAVYLNFDTGHGEISSNPAISVEKDDEEQCGIPYGRWRSCLSEFGQQINAKYHQILHNWSRGLYKVGEVQID